MRMIDLGSQRGPLQIIETATAVECGRQVRFRRSFRSLVECMVPCCGFQPSHESACIDTESTHGSSVTGTFSDPGRAESSFASRITQEAPLCYCWNSLSTPLILQKKCNTACLGLHSTATAKDLTRPSPPPPPPPPPPPKNNKKSYHLRSLFNVTVWTVYCNGRKAGFAVRRQMTENDAYVLKLMQSVSVGAGVLPMEPKSEDKDLMYLRASFERVIGSPDSESFHMINPTGSSGQELSVFLLRS